MVALLRGRARARELLTKWSLSLEAPRHRFVVCSGGGPGIMEAANRGAQRGRREVHRPEHPAAVRAGAEPLHHRRSCIFDFHYFFMRKFWFAYLAKALVIFPGGFGTLDEMFEILTLAQTQQAVEEAARHPLRQRVLERRASTSSRWRSGAPSTRRI